MLFRSQQILGLCLLHERVYGDGRSHWTKSHRRWLVEQKFDHGALAFTYSELLARLEGAEARLSRVRAELQEAICDWALYPVVEAIRALRGFDWENATMMVAEIGRPRRTRPASVCASGGCHRASRRYGRKRGRVKT